MVVAAGAANRQTHHSPAHHVDSVINDVVNIIDKAAAQRQITERRERSFVRSGRQQIRRDLLFQELIEGQVLVESADDVIAIGIGVGIMPVFLPQITFRVGVTRHVQPMAPPPLAVTRGSQQPVHDFGKGVRRFVCLEDRDFLWRWRQPDKVESGAPNQCMFVSFGRGLQMGGFEAGQNEFVHRRARETLILDSGYWRFLDGLKGPMRPGFFPDALESRAPALRDARIRRAHFDPGLQAGDLSVRELLVLGWHAKIVIRITHRLDEEALLRITRLDGRTGIAAFQKALATVQEQTAFDLGALLTVAGIAIVHQNWPNLAFEKLNAGGIVRRPCGPGQRG